ncbi:MAG: hypothetical protein FJW40_18705 [Acidobacteria bacterium]|nr:hypothetical protein [Acidobacteriota bacterium]
MTHEVALRTGAAQRYVLGELRGAEMRAFEEHYFDCLACAQEISDTAATADNLRAVFVAEAKARAAAPAAVSAPGWLDGVRAWFAAPGWAASAAALLLAVTAGYQQFVVIADLRESAAPQPVPVAMLRPASRGAAQAVRVGASERRFALILDFAGTQPGSPLRCEIAGGAGGALRVDAREPQPGQPLVLDLAADKFPAGSYTLSIHRAGQNQPETYQFTVERVI